jgi:glyoxylase-like metal-dependent hydrolase (beta-lactamase superfamily II)
VEDEADVFPTGDAPEEIEPGLWRIPLPLPFALRAVNVYLIDEGPGKRLLVDAGLGLPADRAALRAGLARAGIGLAEISVLVLTHAHPDHIGQAGPILAASRALAYMLEHENERIEHVWRGDGVAVIAALEAMYAANGLPAEHLPTVASSNAAARRMLQLAPAERITTLTDGEMLRVGSHTYRFLWTPGHSDFHACLLREDGLLLVGDHVLPSITPNIGLYPQARPDPLGDYLDSLARMSEMAGIRLALPGHGRPFADLAGRARAIIEHHEERGAEAVAALAAHPAGLSAGEVARVLFAGRLRTGDDWRFALAETLAHLEYLRLRGQLAREERNGLVRYTVLAPA